MAARNHTNGTVATANESASNGEMGLSGWQLARRGVALALNNRVEEAQKLLQKAGADKNLGGVSHSANGCIQSQAGYCFLVFMNALMTFEEEKMSLALTTLKATEKRCSLESSSSSLSSSGLTSSPSFTSFQRLLGGGGAGPQANENKRNADSDPGSRLEAQIIMADCQVLAAVINFLHQDWGSYMKGGWVLRKAWKIYQKLYAQIRAVYIQKIGLGGNTLAPPPPPSSVSGSGDASGSSSTRRAGALSNLSHSRSVPLSLFSLLKAEQSSEEKESPSQTSAESLNSGLHAIPVGTLRRLMSAVSFGYGLFHLAVSLLPGRVLNVIHLFGFEGDRQTGIQALHFARQGQDMRGPIATLTLLWYHTIVRPFFGLDGFNVKSGADAAQRLIDASRSEFADSALFLFFQGRVERLKSNFDGALVAYERALAASAQREIHLLCLHEVGWSYVLLRRWEESSRAFLQLKAESRWSKSFYCYLSSICLGACNELDRCLSLAEETPRLVRTKKNSSNNQLEKFLGRRANKMLVDRPSRDYCLLLSYELLYLWNALGACLKNSQDAIRVDCERIDVPALEGVRQLILGNIYSNTSQIADARMAYGAAIKQGEEVGDIHTAAFAAYELGLLLCRKPETRVEGRSYLEFARDNYRHYDFENRLHVRIQAGLRFYSENANERIAAQAQMAS